MGAKRINTDAYGFPIALTITGQSLFQPCGNHARAYMNIDVVGNFRARVDEFMGHIRLHNHNLTPNSLKCGFTYGKGKHAFLDHKYFFIGVLVQPWPTPWCRVAKEEGDVDGIVKISLELRADVAGWQVNFVDNIWHRYLL